MDNVVLSVLAHPDDAEFLCAGVLARLHFEKSWRVHIATMTAGDCGTAEYSSEEISRIRREEGACAVEVLAGEYHCLLERDLLVQYGERSLEKVTRLLRMVRPRLVLTHSPADYMLDHEMTSTVTRAAAFAASVPNFLLDRQIGQPLDHIPHVYYCDAAEGKDLFGRPFEPGLAVDVSPAMDLKAAMLTAHASQRNWLLKQHGMDHYIESMKTWSARRGQEYGVASAEVFRQHLGHSYPQDDLLGELLGRLRKP
jgi:LmbE family N-acetylglucosaminyl deacetylase